MASQNTEPTAETVALYRELPSDALMVLRTAFELDATRRDLSTGARQFIRGRLALIDRLITERTEYLHE
jgi:hypothetical protein